MCNNGPTFRYEIQEIGMTTKRLRSAIMAAVLVTTVAPVRAEVPLLRGIAIEDSLDHPSALVEVVPVGTTALEPCLLYTSPSPRD